MTLRQYLSIMFIATVLCWTAWGFVIFNVDPYQASTLTFVFFYLSLLLSLLGTISLILFSVYSFFGREPLPMFRYVQRSFRDSMILTLVIGVLLYLQSKGWLHVWNFGLFMGAILCFLLFVTFHAKSNVKSETIMP
jgi:hypothetical protein